MFWSGSTAAADDLAADLQKATRKTREVIWVVLVKNPSIDLARHASVGLGAERQIDFFRSLAHGFQNHARATAAVKANHAGAGGGGPCSGSASSGAVLGAHIFTHGEESHHW